ncbi:MAG: type I-E CRISPR-associated protein Cas5/CasD [Syntrophales bacterium]
MEFIAIRLYGPMASWGDTTLTRRRPTLYAPTKSAIAGLLGAALGWPRDKGEGFWLEFASSFGMAAKVDHVRPQTLGDYHTVFTYKQDEPLLCATRSEEVEVIRKRLSARKDDWKNCLILTSRYYLVDFLATVLIWQRRETLPPLKDIVEALVCPRFSLYLGRKSCPLALPLEPNIISADSLSEAFIKTAKCFTQFECVKSLQRGKEPMIYWEDSVPLGEPLGSASVMTRTCNDIPVSRTSWTFSSRPFNYASWPKEVPT